MAAWYRVLHPRPVLILIAGIEKPNPMALAWHTPVSDSGLVAVAVDKENYTYELIRKCGEFTLNVVDIEKLRVVWVCGTKSGREVDKVRLAGLELEDGVKIRTKHLKDSLAFLECKVEREVDCEDHSLFIARVVYWRARNFDRVWREGTRIAMHVGSVFFCWPSRYVRAPRV